MGIGDQVPAGLRQLGAEVTLLGPSRARRRRPFPVRHDHDRHAGVRRSLDLRTFNQRLLDYVKNGGNMVVLYNTQEFDPNTFAPYPAELPRNAEEVSEEDSPVSILSPENNRSRGRTGSRSPTSTGWIEQRGSKFFSTWNDEYRPMISTFDTGQSPQRGGWLTARVRERDVDLLRLRPTPPASVRCSWRVPHYRQPACSRQGPEVSRAPRCLLGRYSQAVRRSGMRWRSSSRCTARSSDSTHMSASMGRCSVRRGHDSRHTPSRRWSRPSGPADIQWTPTSSLLTSAAIRSPISNSVAR